MKYPTIEDAIGKTPLVALQRIGTDYNAARNNVVLGKLEGNNPAGSVKDRPALSMIQRAQERVWPATSRKAVVAVLVSGAAGHSAGIAPRWSIPLKSLHLLALALGE